MPVFAPGGLGSGYLEADQCQSKVRAKRQDLEKPTDLDIQLRD